MFAKPLENLDQLRIIADMCMNFWNQYMLEIIDFFY